jgi:hypothetical protein
MQAFEHSILQVAGIQVYQEERTCEIYAGGGVWEF